MNTVIFETAKRLAEAGFPQPAPERGQTWWSESVAEYLIQAVNQDGTVDYSCGTAYPFLSRRLDADGCVFAPTATGILREIPGWSIAWIVDRMNDESAWFYWRVDTPELCYSHPTNPAEAAAQAWLSIHEQ